MKRRIILFTYLLLISLSEDLFCLTIQDLITIAFENNSEIVSATDTYETELISAKTVNGYYSPNITLSLSSDIPRNYKWNSEPDSFSSDITYSQVLPGGTTLNLVTGYSCGFFDMSIGEQISQNPQISLALSQSLRPFWIQGIIQDPIKLSLEQQKEYYYYQLIYTKKKVLQNLVQNYIYTLTTQNEMKICNNTIKLYEEEIDSLQELKATGSINESKILEIENSRWNAMQNLLTSQGNYIGYIQKLKSICGQDFDDKDFESLSEHNVDTLIQIYFNPITNKDPLEQAYKLKLEILKTQRIVEHQSSAAILNLSVQPVWNLETENEDNWKKVWNYFEKPANWKLTIGINLSPALAAIAKQNQKAYNIAYEAAKESYDSYLKQKAFVKQQYESLLDQYNNQQKIISNLCESGIKELNDYKVLFESQSISKLDYDTVKVRIENSFLTKENIELNILLYEFMIKIN